MARRKGKRGKKGCKGWCTPTRIYLALAVVSTVLSLFTSNNLDEQYNGGQNKAILLAGHLASGALWTGILYWLCQNCYNTAAWVILLMPFIMIGLMVAFAGGDALMQQVGSGGEGM